MALYTSNKLVLFPQWEEGNFKIKFLKSNFFEDSSVPDMDLLRYIQILKGGTYPTITFKEEKSSLKNFFFSKEFFFPLSSEKPFFIKFSTCPYIVSYFFTTDVFLSV